VTPSFPPAPPGAATRHGSLGARPSTRQRSLGAGRIRALVRKDLAELRHSPGIFFPGVLTGLATVLYPFVIAVIVPYFAGERLSDSSDFEIAAEMYRSQPGSRSLGPEGAIQAAIFQWALTLLVGLTTVTGSMSVAAHSVIGEKQARSLEPLLATPLTTFELLAAKAIGAAVPGVSLTTACFALYVVMVAAFAEPGVWTSLLTPYALMLVFVLGPLAGLVGLQLAVCASARTNDPRSAQQIGALFLVVPIAALQIAQFMGGLLLTPWVMILAAALFLVANVVIMRIAIGLFDRESILTRWK
jgi:ABC-2 type transport system permease protein